jgi:hypothetical protein
MILCEKEDLALAGMVIERYNALKRAEETNFMSDESAETNKEIDTAIDEKIYELYGRDEEPDMVEVPIELFHRMAAEVEHHKAMLTGQGAGVVVTLGGSTSSVMEYGIAKDLSFSFRLNIRAGRQRPDRRGNRQNCGLRHPCMACYTRT